MTSKYKDKIDESLYSRQLLTLGRDAMVQMTKKSVLISCTNNFSGLGIEVAKCVILTGVGKVSIHSTNDILTNKDLASNYYANVEDIGLPFREKVIASLKSLNYNVEVGTEEIITADVIKTYDCVVFCDYNVYDLLYWNRICRTNNVKFIMAQTYGLAGNIFCDFGNKYIINDVDGEPAHSGIIVKSENSEMITSEPHNLCTGDIIDVNEIGNYEDGEKFLIKVVSATSFNLYEYKKEYESHTQEQRQIFAFKTKHLNLEDQQYQNTMFKQIKLPVTVYFKSLEASLKEPEIQMFDTAVWEMPKILNAFMRALSM